MPSLDRKKATLLILFVVGFCAIPAQIILLREFLLVFGGNELIIGLFLAIWMMLTALGSYAARFMIILRRHIPVCAIVLAWMPVFMIYLIDFLRNRVLLPGIESGILQILVSSFLVLLPFCFLSGLLFSSAAGYLVKSFDSALTDKAYAIESFGSMAGGILFSLVLVYLYDNLRSAVIVAFLGSMLLLIFRTGKIATPPVIAGSILMIALAVTTFMTGGRLPRQFLFQNQDLLEIRDTPYGNLAVTSTSGQLNFFDNNTLLYSADNLEVSEEAVHFAMVQHADPRKVLLISGGIAGLPKEILKYGSVKILDYIEIDPVILSLARKYTSFLANKKISTIRGDPRIYLRRPERKYDVVIVFLPFPSSFQINRYYTLEFMTDVKKCLNPDGIFTFQLPITGSYLNEGSVNIYSSLFRSCKQVFRYVSIFPGQNCYIVASDSGIKTNIGQLIEYKNIKNDYVNSYYIDEAEMLRNSSDIMKQLDPGVKPNTDFRPVAVNGFYHYWLNRFHIEFRSFRLYALLVAALIILVLAFASPAFSGMFAAGFTGSALQVILILSFQIVCGYILRSIGLFTAVFMAGLAMGSMFRRKLLTSSSTRVLVYLQLILAGLSALVPVMVQFSDNINHLPVMVHLLYMVLILLISATSGIVFSISVNNSGIPKEVSLPQVYGSDLAGSSLGAFVTILLLIPAAGIKPAAYLAGLLNGVVAVIMIIRFRRTNNG